MLHALPLFVGHERQFGSAFNLLSVTFLPDIPDNSNGGREQGAVWDCEFKKKESGKREKYWNDGIVECWVMGGSKVNGTIEVYFSSIFHYFSIPTVTLSLEPGDIEIPEYFATR